MSDEEQPPTGNPVVMDSRSLFTFHALANGMISWTVQGSTLEEAQENFIKARQWVIKQNQYQPDYTHKKKEK
jgi:hypothetical protein